MFPIRTNPGLQTQRGWHWNLGGSKQSTVRLLSKYSQSSSNLQYAGQGSYTSLSAHFNASKKNLDLVYR